MAITLISSVALALLVSFVMGSRPIWDAHKVFGKGPVEGLEKDGDVQMFG
jgi:hypothetical protein